MMHYFENIYNIIKQIRWFNKSLNQQSAYANQLLANYKSNFHISSNNKAIKYATYIPIFIGQPYTKLRNKAFCTDELERITLLGSLTALFDDLFDNQEYDYSKLQFLLENPIISTNNTDFENSLITIYNQILESSKNKILVSDLAKKIHFAQLESTKQQSNNLSTPELTNITYNKGGYSMLLYRAAFDEPISALEKQLYYKIGAIGQLENDIFDIYKDSIDGIHTLATETDSIATLRSIYNNLKLEIFSLVDSLNYPQSQKTEFKLSLKLIIERGNIALNFYEKSSKETQSQFKPQELSKKRLICDMEKPINIVKLIHYASSCCKK